MALSLIAVAAAKEIGVQAVREAATQAAREIAQKMATESLNQAVGKELQSGILERQAVQDGFRVGEMPDAKGDGREVLKQRESESADNLCGKLDAGEPQSGVEQVSGAENAETQNVIEAEMSSVEEVQGVAESQEAIHSVDVSEVQESGATVEAVGSVERVEGQAALRDVIKCETGWSDEIVGSIRNEGEYGVYKHADLKEGSINGRSCLQREIDPNFKDDFGRTNVERMQRGLSPYDAESGEKLELHHMGQRADSPFAELRENIDHGDGNHHVLHDLKTESWRHDPGRVADYANQRTDYWKARAEQLLSA